MHSSIYLFGIFENACATFAAKAVVYGAMYEHYLLKFN